TSGVLRTKLSRDVRRAIDRLGQIASVSVLAAAVAANIDHDVRGRTNLGGLGIDLIDHLLGRGPEFLHRDPVPLAALSQAEPGLAVGLIPMVLDKVRSPDGIPIEGQRRALAAL